MKGRASFAAEELHQIEHSLKQLRSCDAGQRRRLRSRLRRRHRFYLSDFALRTVRSRPRTSSGSSRRA